MLLTMLLAAAQPDTDTDTDTDTAPAAAAAAAAAAADSRMLDLTEGEGGQHCLPDGQLCLELSGNPDAGAVPANLILSFDSPEKISLPLPVFSGNPKVLRLWPHLVQVRGSAGAYGGKGFLVGVVSEQRATYSGYSDAARLHLLRLVEVPHAIGIIGEVLDVVWNSSQMIRVCFSEQDAKDRLDACYDEYAFKAVLKPGADDGGELPSLTYRSFATAYPQPSRRREDNSWLTLKIGDLARWKDADCSYERALRHNPATGRYEMDRPAPDCSVYTTP
ncbi:MAG: hypothetical protein JHD35_13725 [Sphingopyxis sp.]|nr:hypothetical protein [Sphingopyxis sp.]